MTYAATIYVDSAGNKYGASETDQCYTTAAVRTVMGRPVMCAGPWYGSQMGYRPFRAAVEAAQTRAAQLEIG